MNTLRIPCDVGDVSDGYHTFKELYDHRCVLFMNLAILHIAEAFMTRKNSDGDKWEGWFILGINTEFGQITYHLPDKYWNYLEGIIPVIDKNVCYDGHSSSDVLDRLLDMIPRCEAA